MGVDWYTCSNCTETYPDCGYYFRCTGCEMSFCTDKCGGKKVIEQVDDEYGEQLTSCILCRNEDATESELYHYALRRLSMDHEVLKAEYLEDKKKNK